MTAPSRLSKAQADSDAPKTDNGPHLLPHLCIQDLHAGYGQTEVLRGVNLDLPAGKSLCLVGPNGAGKSTILNAIFGLANVTQGRITFAAIDVAPLQPAQRLAALGIAYVLQDSSIFPDLSVEQNLRLGAYLLNSRAGAKTAAEIILDRYPRLADRRTARAGVLSGGERRQLEIARALMMKPRLLLIDEPTIGLEPKLIEAVFSMLRELQERDGMSILLVEQNVRQGLAYADNGAVLVAGELVSTGVGSDLLGNQKIKQMFLGG